VTSNVEEFECLLVDRNSLSDVIFASDFRLQVSVCPEDGNRVSSDTVAVIDWPTLH
jgi:hypothetical protein